MIIKYNIDISHFTGQTWNKGINYLEKTAIVPLSKILQENTNFQSDQLKKRLISEGIKEYKCEKCGELHKNIIANDDNIEEIISISVQKQN